MLATSRAALREVMAQLEEVTEHVMPQDVYNERSHIAMILASGRIANILIEEEAAE